MTAEQITLEELAGTYAVYKLPPGICASCRRQTDRGRYHLRRAHQSVYHHRPNLAAGDYALRKIL